MQRCQDRGEAKVNSINKVSVSGPVGSQTDQLFLSHKACKKKKEFILRRLTGTII